MAREEKQSEGSGSALLGAELRRLRGTRTLEEIASLTRSPPLAGIVPPMAVTTLSEIELGHQLPRVTTLYTLSMIYRVSMNQLMGYVIEESMAAAQVPPEGTTEELTEKFNRLLSIAEWHRALPIAIALEKRATTEREKVRWRGNRATCMAQMGLANEAIALYLSCIESPAITPRQEFVLQQSLANTLASAGHYKSAARVTKELLESVPSETTPVELGSVRGLRAELLIVTQQLTPLPSEALLREIIRLTEQAEPSLADDGPALMRLRLLRARAFRLLGNSLFAEQEFAKVQALAAQAGYARLEAGALLELGILTERAGQATKAEVHYQRSLLLAETSQQYDLQFEASLALFKLLRNERPGSALKHYRRCRSLLSVLPSGLPSVREFERIVAEFDA